MKKKELPIDEIIKKYEGGTSERRLAKEYGVSQITIRNRIQKYYEKIGKEKPKRLYLKKELPIDEIIKKYEAGFSQSQIAKEYDVSQRTISSRIIEHYKITSKEKPKKVYPKIELPIEDIIKKYEKGITPLNLAEKYGVSRMTIANRIEEYYQQSDKIKPKLRRNFKELPIDEIIKKYQTGTSQRKLAEEYDVSQVTISNRIQEYYTKTGKEKPERVYPKIELPIEEIIKKYEQGTSRFGIRKRIWCFANYYFEKNTRILYKNR